MLALGVEIDPRQRMGVEPVLRQHESNHAVAGPERQPRHGLAGAPALQQCAQAQQHREPDGRHGQALGQGVELLQRDRAALRAHDERQCLLLLAREAEQVGVAHQVGAVHLVLAVRDGEPDLVHAAGPGQPVAVRLVELPGVLHLVVQAHRRGLHPRRMRRVDAVAARQRQHAGLARIGVAGPADQVVEQALAHRRLAGAHAVDVERAEHRFQDQGAAGDHRAAILGQGGQADALDLAGIEQALAHLVEAIEGDAVVGRPQRGADLAQRAHGAGGADGVAPAARAVAGGELLQLDLDLGLRLLPALARELAVVEEAPRGGDAADLDALGLQRLVAQADDELGAAAADVHHQAPLLAARDAVGDAEVDQARLLAAGHHLDRMAERGFGREQEGARGAQLAHGVGRHRAHALRRQLAQALAEAREAGQGAALALRLQGAVRAQAHGHAHAVAQAVDDAQFAELVARHHQVEAVRAQVDRGERVAFADGRVGFGRHGSGHGSGGGMRAGRWGRLQPRPRPGTEPGPVAAEAAPTGPVEQPGADGFIGSASPAAPAARSAAWRRRPTPA